jgi:3-methylcrotonyl-CoA carboxylase alpha subunit
MLAHLRAPAEGPHVRVDTGVRAGDTISIHYDPMIAKLIVWDRDRASAAQRLSEALAQYEVVGVTTNLAFLKTLADHPAFRAAELDTGFIGRHGGDLFPAAGPAPRLALAAAALRLLTDRQAAVTAKAALSHDPHSPWNLAHAWRMNGSGYQDLVLLDGEATVSVRAHPRGQGFLLDLPDGPALVGAQDDILTLDGVKQRVALVRIGDELTIMLDGVNHKLTAVDPLKPAKSEAAGVGRLTAPMPGKITQVLVAAGDTVKRGAALLVVEAMKMEHTITAPMDGLIDRVRYAVGDLVEDGAELIAFAEEGVK